MTSKNIYKFLVGSIREHNITFLRGSKEKQQYKCAEGLTEGT